MLITDFLDYAAGQLGAADLCFGHGTNNPIDEAYFLVLGALQIEFEVDSTQLQRNLSASEQNLLEDLLTKRLKQRIPVAYILGFTMFAGYRFIVDSRALIPRSPIAELILRGYEPFVREPVLKILDLCTGGGCIGIASALEIPEAKVDLVDISTDALELAGKNVEAHKLERRVSLLQSDLFDKITGHYQLIVCNPPYVSSQELRTLPREYKFEPELGLYSGDKGLSIPLRILKSAADYLTESGVLILEVGYSKQDLIDRYPHVPFLWLEFEHGGDGVLVMNKAQLLEYRDCFI